MAGLDKFMREVLRNADASFFDKGIGSYSQSMRGVERALAGQPIDKSIRMTPDQLKRLGEALSSDIPMEGRTSVVDALETMSPAELLTQSPFGVPAGRGFRDMGDGLLQSRVFNSMGSGRSPMLTIDARQRPMTLTPSGELVDNGAGPTSLVLDSVQAPQIDAILASGANPRFPLAYNGNYPTFVGDHLAYEAARRGINDLYIPTDMFAGNELNRAMQQIQDKQLYDALWTYANSGGFADLNGRRVAQFSMRPEMVRKLKTAGFPVASVLGAGAIGSQDVPMEGPGAFGVP